MSGKHTAIITGASRGIGAGLVQGFLERGYNVVATSRHAKRELAISDNLVLLDGDVSQQQTAADAVDAAIKNFGTIDVLVNNAGIFLARPFTEFSREDFDALVSTNLLGFFYFTQRTVREMVKQKSGCVVSVTAALADRPIAGENGSISMITKGGLNSAIRNLGPAVSFARSGITAAWDPKFASLLELAEACDVPVRWSCRTGVCHTCMTGLIGGSISYNPEPLENPAPGNLLICCSQPNAVVTLDL